MDQKQILLEKLIKQPLDFGELDFKHLIDPAFGLTFDDLRSALKRVYNMNENALRAESDATTGAMGLFNRYMSAKRKKAYFAKINDGFVGKDGHKVLVAEGDSWFQFFGRDVINWLANILFEEKYIEELSIHKPSAFLVSGGGRYSFN